MYASSVPFTNNIFAPSTFRLVGSGFRLPGSDAGLPSIAGSGAFDCTDGVGLAVTPGVGTGRVVISDFGTLAACCDGSRSASRGPAGSKLFANWSLNSVITP